MQFTMEKNDDAEALRILTEYPLIVPYPDFKKWEGFIQSKNVEAHLELDIPNYPSLKGISIRCTPEVYPLLIPLRDQAEESSLLNLLRSMSHALKSKSLFATESLDIDKQKLETVISVLKDFEIIGTSNIADLNHDDQSVTLSYVDSSGDTHQMVTHYNSDYPKSVLRIVKVDLPVETVSTLEGSTNYAKLYESFRESVEGLIPFWEVAKDLEDECWVIDPEVPQRKDSYRRIFLTTDLSISINFNTLRIGEMPDIKFFGCVSTVEQKRAEFLGRLEQQGWNNEQDIVSNLKRLLDIDKFPKKPLPTESQDALECIICVGGLEQNAPVQKWCNNDKCSSVYHRACLYRWFDELQTARRYWDYISGPCPLCKAKILCPINEDVPAKK